MTDPDATFDSAPELRNNAPKAPGIMPKNAQTWTVVAIAAVMILVIAFSSAGVPRPRPKSIIAERQNASPPNQRQVDQYRAMVDEEARKLALERQRLDRAKLDLQNTMGSAQLASAGGAAPYEQQPVRAASASPERSPEEAQRIALEAERKKREYTSLFSSNVSLTFRKDERQAREQVQVADQDGAAAPLLQAFNAQLKGLAQTAVNSAATTPELRRIENSPATSSTDAPANQRDKPEKRDVSAHGNEPALEAADGPKYRLFEGTVLETVLTNRLDGSFSGPVNCMTTTNVYSRDHQHMLVPQGSRVLGEVQKVNSFGQQRLAVFFHRVIMPDGYSLNLDQFHGLNQVGETGLRDQVNRHYLETFGISLAIGAIAGIEQAGASYGYNTGGVDAYRRGVSESLSQSALRILDRYLNILPTFTVREGHRIKIYLSDDLMLPAYDRHRIPGNI
jgi:type IV secretion system protein VirB10